MLSQQNEAPWVDNPTGSVASKLQKIEQELSAGNTVKAAERIEELQEYVSDMTSHEHAEYFFLQAKVKARYGDIKASNEFYKKAKKQCDLERYSLAYMEGVIAETPFPENKVKQIALDLAEDTHYQCVVKAKCLALTGEVDKALAIIEGNYPEKIVSKLFISFIGDDHEVIAKAIEEIDEDTLTNNREQFIFHNCCLRFFVEKAIGRKLFDVPSIAPSGEASYKLEFIQKAHKHAEKAWQVAAKLGYPADVITLIDPSFVTYGYLGVIDKLIVLIRELHLSAPSNDNYLYSLSTALFNAHKYQEVFDVLFNRDKLSRVLPTLLAFSCYHLAKKEEMNKVMVKYMDQICESESELTPMVLKLGEVAAESLFEFELAKQLKDKLSSFDSAAHFDEIQAFMTKCNEDMSQISFYADELYQKYIDLDKPLIIAEQLFRYLDEREAKQAKRCVELGEHILSSRELHQDEYKHLVNALITSEQLELAEQIADKQLQKNAQEYEWYILRSIIHNRRGEIGKARDAMQYAISKGTVDSPENLMAFIEVSLTFGFTEDAIKACKTILAKAKSKEDKKQITHILISLMTRNGSFEGFEVSQSIKKYGELVDQNSVEEEGRFLLFWLFAEHRHFEKKYINEIRSRYETYFENYPDSKILRRAKWSEDASVDEILDQVNTVSGMNSIDTDKLEENRQKVLDGTLPLPLCVLHKNISGSGDVYHSWLLSQSPEEWAQIYTINHSPQQMQNTFVNNITNGKAMFDETALLTLSSLGVLDHVFDNLNGIYLLTSVLDGLSAAAHAFGGSVNKTDANAILKTVQNHFKKVVQINDQDDMLVSYGDYCSENGVTFITDDNNLLFFVRYQNNDIQFGNSINCIAWLNSLNCVTTKECCETIINLGKLGFKSPEINAETLLNIFAYYQHKAPDALLDELPCFEFIEQVLDIEKNRNALNNIIYLTTRLYLKLSPKQIVGLIQSFAKINKKVNLKLIIATIHIVASTIRDPQREIALFNVSRPHYVAWSQYVEIYSLLVKVDTSIEELLEPIIWGINHQKKSNIQTVIFAIICAFDEGSTEYNYILSRLRSK